MSANSDSVENAVWDSCVIGNGVSALWAVTSLRNRGLSVLWVTSEEPCSVGRASLTRGWSWGVTKEHAAELSVLLGVSKEFAFQPFEAVYFDARSSKRFRQFGETKVDWGTHEIPVLSGFFDGIRAKNLVDLTPLHEFVLNDYKDLPRGSAPLIEFSQDPKVVIVQSSLLVEIKTSAGIANRIESLEFAFGKMSDTAANAKPGEMPLGVETLTVQAKRFILGDFDENFSAIVKDAAISQRLSVPWRGRVFEPGFSLSFTHKDNDAFLGQFQIIPLVANPSKKGAGSHVVGRFLRQDQKTPQSESTWFGFLTEEELEDNNEILKKIKSAKRVLEKTIPGFSESILQESLTFEPQMCVTGVVSKRPQQALGALIVTDVYGPEGAVEGLKNVVKELEHGTADPNAKKIHSKSHLRGADREERGTDRPADGMGVETP